jgi:hypothetical protein
MKILRRVKGVLFEPSKFFEAMKKEKGVGNAFFYYAVLSLFVTVLGTILGYFLMPFSTAILSKIIGVNLPVAQLSFLLLSTLTVIGYGLGLLFSFVAAGILHAWILIFGGKEGYDRTYNLYVYSRTPNFIFGWIPFVSFFIWIYSLILLIIGTEKMHGISRLKAILMYVIPIAVFIVLMVFIIIFAIYLISSAHLTIQIPGAVQ